MLKRYTKTKKKHEPDIEFIALFSLSTCVDRLEDLGRSEFAITDDLRIRVDPIDAETWIFRASRPAFGRLTVEINGSLLKKDDTSTLIIIKGNWSEGTAQFINAIFVILLLIILGATSIFIAAKDWGLALLIASVGLLPLFNWRFNDFESRIITEGQRLHHHIRQTLE